MKRFAIVITVPEFFGQVLVGGIPQLSRQTKPSEREPRAWVFMCVHPEQTKKDLGCMLTERYELQLCNVRECGLILVLWINRQSEVAPRHTGQEMCLHPLRRLVLQAEDAEASCDQVAVEAIVE